MMKSIDKRPTPPLFVTIGLAILMSSVRHSMSLIPLRSTAIHTHLKCSTRPIQTALFSVSAPSEQTLSVAPMMAHTNRHFRKFWRLISKRSTLYTEMVVADMMVTAAMQNNLFQIEKHYGHNSEVENPLVLQLGGNDPEKLRQATALACMSGFRSINLNCGCPSNTVASANSMGAAMMYTPERTAECCAAMIDAMKVRKSATDSAALASFFANGNKHMSDESFSVKCRTGVDELDSYDDLRNFIQIVSSQGGVKRFQIHARKALLGVSTMANRDVPPLQYERVVRLVDDFPHLEFEINGAISTPQAVKLHLSNTPNLKGVMVGRACINHPYMWIKTDSEIYGDSDDTMLTRGEILDQYIQYCESVETLEESQRGQGREKTPIRVLLAPVFNLFNGEENCVKFRREMDKMSVRCTSSSVVLKAAAKTISPEGLNGRRGEFRNPDEITVYEKMKKSTGRMKITVS